MNRIRAPLDEKRKQPCGIVFQAQRFPSEQSPVWALARTGHRTFDREALVLEAGSKCVEVRVMYRPADQGRVVVQASQIKRVRAGWLLGIGRDDFQIAA